MATQDEKVSKFLHTLQNIMKCSACDKTLIETIFMCLTGHTICRNCAVQRLGCKKCHAPYTLMRNIFAEDFMSQFSEKKECSEKLSAPKIQPEPEPSLVSSSSIFPVVKLPPRHYRCWITTKCEFTGCLASVIEHLKSSAHAKRYFKEHADGKMPLKKYWDMSYSVGTNYNRAVHIPKIGLFILYIWENAHDQLNACIFMCARNSAASQYSYTIQISCGGRHQSLKSPMVSARTPKQTVHGLNFECLKLQSNDPLYIAMKEQSGFKCSIIIEQNATVKCDDSNQCSQMALKNTSSNRKKNRNRQRNTNNAISIQHTNKNKPIIMNIRNSVIHLDPNLIKAIGLNHKEKGSQLKLT